MILYLIRHGKTDAHLEGRRQSPDSPLGDYGLKQAAAVAEVMSQKKLDFLYSSDWPRARQTAGVVSDKIGLPLRIHPLVHENQNAAELHGIGDNDDINLIYIKERAVHTEDFDWKFNGGGESTNEVIARVKKVLKFLTIEHSNDTLAVVTHGNFIRILTTLLLLGDDFDNKTFMKLFLSLETQNAGICKFEFDPVSASWKLLCFNSHDHLEK